MRFFFCAAIVAFLSAPAYAQEKNNQTMAGMQLPADVVENNKKYEDALAKLPPAQKQNVRTIVENGAPLYQPFVEILSSGLLLKDFCLPRKLMDESYRGKFKKLQQHTMKETGAAIKAYKANVISQVTYMDHDVISRRILGNYIIENRKVAAEYKMLSPTLPAPKVEGDCKDLKQSIDTQGAKNKLF